HKTFGETILSDRFVVVTRIGGPAGAKGENRCSCIGDAMRDASVDVMNASRLDSFAPGPSLFVHHDEHAFAFDAPIKFTAAFEGVEMSLGHDVFASDQSRIQVRNSEKQTAFGAVFDWEVAFYFVGDFRRVSRSQGVVVLEQPGKIPNCSRQLFNAVS